MNFVRLNNRPVFFRPFQTSDRISRLALGLAVLPFLLPMTKAFAAQSVATAQRPNILLVLADDWSFPHAGIYGDEVVKTPNFDRIARSGVLFNNAYCAAPSCSPSRAAILTGKYPHQLEDAANLWGKFDKKYPTYPDVLEASGYTVGYTRKGWSPGNIKAGGRTRNPAGPLFEDFATFMKTVPSGQPFCFWFGSKQPHRHYVEGVGREAGLNIDAVKVPPFWPDSEVVRSDILDYYAEIQKLDHDLGDLLSQLEAAGQLENTLIVVTADNGMPFPRTKANLYDHGTREPMALQWPAKIKPNQVVDDFVSLVDLAPTFLEAAGISPLPATTGRSLIGLLTGAEKPGLRNEVFIERERHANVREADLGYPVRAVRTHDYLYIRNGAPDRWPAGDPVKWKAVGAYGDVDDGPAKAYLIAHREEFAAQFQLVFGKRPPDELYDVKKDPFQLNNLAGQSAYAAIQAELSAKLDRWMVETHDPRVDGDDGRWDKMRYFGPTSEEPVSKPDPKPKSDKS